MTTPPDHQILPLIQHDCRLRCEVGLAQRMHVSDYCSLYHYRGVSQEYGTSYIINPPWQVAVFILRLSVSLPHISGQFWP